MSPFLFVSPFPFHSIPFYCFGQSRADFASLCVSKPFYNVKHLPIQLCCNILSGETTTKNNRKKRYMYLSKDISLRSALKYLLLLLCYQTNSSIIFFMIVIVLNRNKTFSHCTRVRNLLFMIDWYIMIVYIPLCEYKKNISHFDKLEIKWSIYTLLLYNNSKIAKQLVGIILVFYFFFYREREHFGKKEAKKK